MSQFLNETLSDLRGGRETWRVFVILGGPAFTIALLVSLIQIS